jgi:hypothetical protein
MNKKSHSPNLMKKIGVLSILVCVCTLALAWHTSTAEASQIRNVKIVKLKKGVTLTYAGGPYPDMSVYPLEDLEITLNGETILADGAWSYTAEEEGEVITIAVTAYHQEEEAGAANEPNPPPAPREIRHLTPRSPNTVIFDPDAAFASEGEYIFPAVFCDAGDYGPWDEPWPEVTLLFSTGNPRVNIHHNGQESVIAQKDDYPEVAFVTFVAINNHGVLNANTPPEDALYSGPTLRIHMMNSRSMTDPAPYHLVNLTERGFGFGNKQGPDEDDPAVTAGGMEPESDPTYNIMHWKGLYYAMDGCDNMGTLGYNNSPLGYMPGIAFSITADKNPVVIGVHSWSYKQTNTTLDFSLLAYNFSNEALSRTTLDVGVNFDHVDLVREKFVRRYGDIAAVVYPEPFAVGHYTGDPGRFIVYLGPNTLDAETGRGRPYSEIMRIMADVQKGRLEEGPAGDSSGLDWLEVAAADIYNANGPVYSCVWEIVVAPTGSSGSVWGLVPWVVFLDPRGEAVRFNKQGWGRYNFRYDRWRDGLIAHEGLHSYHLLPGKDVDDEEPPASTFGDALYVTPGGGQNAHLRYSYDAKQNGFLRRNRLFALCNDYYGSWIAGLSGDNISHNNTVAHFIIRIDQLLSKESLRQVLNREDVALELPSPVPDLLPLPVTNDASHSAYYDPYLGCIVELFLYRFPWQGRPGRGVRLPPSFIQHKNREVKECRRSNGMFKYREHYLLCTGRNYSGPLDGNEVFEKLQRRSGPFYGLYARLTFIYPHTPFEFDASYYAITR